MDKNQACILIAAVYFSLIFPSSSKVFGQLNLLPGQLITLNGDTISGFIKYKSPDLAHKELHFLHPDGSRKTYLPGDILGYMIHSSGDVYLSGSWQKDERERSPVFLKLVVKGNVSLFFLIDKEGAYRYFIQGAPVDALVELTSTDQFIITDRIAYSTTHKEFYGVLRQYLADCESALERIPQTSLSQKSLSRLLVYYNDCISEVEYFNPPVQFRELSAFGGLNYSFISPNDYFLDRPQAVYGGVAGIRYSHYFSTVRPGGGIFAELSFSKKGARQEGHRRNPYTLAEFNLPYLDIAAGFKYCLPMIKWTPVMAIGGQYGFLLKSTRDAYRYIPRFETDYVNIFSPNQASRTEIGILGEIGAEIPVWGGRHTYGIYFRYERNDLSFKPINLSYYSHIFQFKMSYHFYQKKCGLRTNNGVQ